MKVNYKGTKIRFGHLSKKCRRIYLSQGANILGMPMIQFIVFYAKNEFNEDINELDDLEVKKWLVAKFPFKSDLRKAAAKLAKAKLKKGLVELTYVELKALKYEDFLLTKYWNRVRLAVLRRDNKSCTRCNSKRILQAHHLTYKNHGNEMEHLEDLITLCKVCHRKTHGIK